MQPLRRALSAPTEHPRHAGMQAQQRLLVLQEERDGLRTITPDEGVGAVQTTQLVLDAATQLVSLGALGLKLLQLVPELADGPALAREVPQQRAAHLHGLGAWQAGGLQCLRMSPAQDIPPGTRLCDG